jgi:hypothetical protein
MFETRKEPTDEEKRAVFKWLGEQCIHLGSPAVKAAAIEICRVHQEQIRGLQGEELEKQVDTLWLGYVSEAKAAIWAVIRSASPKE